MTELADSLRHFLSAYDPQSTVIGPGEEAVIGDLLRAHLIFILHDQHEARYVLTDAGRALLEASDA